MVWWDRRPTIGILCCIVIMRRITRDTWFNSSCTVLVTHLSINGRGPQGAPRRRGQCQCMTYNEMQYKSF